MSKKSLKAEYDNFKMYHVTGMIKHGTTVLSKRVWWKPWTWKRKKIFIGGEWEKIDRVQAVPKLQLRPSSDFHGEIDSVSIYSVLPDGTKVPYVHIPTDEELEAWNGDNKTS